MTLRKLLVWTTIALLGLLAGCSGGDTASTEEEGASETAAIFEVDPATAGAVTGKVSFTGKAPKRRPIDMSSEASCASAHGGKVLPENFVPGDGGTLQQVFVYVKSDFGGARFEVPSEPVVLDQKNCVYNPHVTGAMAGQTIRYTNSDPVTHNVHPSPEKNRDWNNSQSPGADPIEKAFSRPEIAVVVKCDVHPWMRTYVHVMKHPYFDVTGSDGSFEIKNLPPGTYTLVAWQQHFGEQEMEVTIGESATAEVEFTYTGK